MHTRLHWKQQFEMIYGGQKYHGLMTGLIYNRPKEPLIFLETAIAQIRTNPKEELTWDMFIDRGKVDILCMF
ncbi:hypothetical protein NECAME_07099 [Necator americanus]|uniref:Uncharacterized protein n=1 Tax=Necator americanus TaxID=51031 RepID=W2TQB9_NECAM|nr:hypothetical protein NECAME_07099 [Necator americanus]ETN84003.1 hypothetical protein NECAME_07099 [Necator americanus]